MIKSHIDSRLVVLYPELINEFPALEKRRNDDWKAILRRLIGFRDDKGRGLAGLFMEVPDRGMYPDYYVIVCHLSNMKGQIPGFFCLDTRESRHKVIRFCRNVPLGRAAHVQQCVFV